MLCTLMGKVLNNMHVVNGVTLYMECGLVKVKISLEKSDSIINVLTHSKLQAVTHVGSK